MKILFFIHVFLLVEQILSVKEIKGTPVTVPIPVPPTQGLGAHAPRPLYILRAWAWFPLDPAQERPAQFVRSVSLRLVPSSFRFLENIVCLICIHYCTVFNFTLYVFNICSLYLNKFADTVRVHCTVTVQYSILDEQYFGMNSSSTWTTYSVAYCSLYCRKQKLYEQIKIIECYYTRTVECKLCAIYLIYISRKLTVVYVLRRPASKTVLTILESSRRVPSL